MPAEVYHFTVKSAVWNVLGNVAFNAGGVYSVMCDLTPVLATEHFSLEESYSVVITTKPMFNEVLKFLRCSFEDRRLSE